jgi:hypothetical protein
MTQTTATTYTTHSTSVLDLLAAREAVDRIKPVNEWMLVAPDGRVWITADVQELFMVLSPHHPLLKVTT